jgi:peptide/nickel transport system permease protein
VRRAPLVPLFIVILVLSGAALSFVLVGRILPDDHAIDLARAYSPPVPLPGSSADHLLGTDALGRDMLSRLLVGARLSLSVALLSVFVSACVGSALGAIAGYAGGLTEALIMRTADIGLSLPAILVALVFVASIGPSYGMVCTILVVLLWPQFARLVRGEVASLKHRDFVALARVAGAGPFTILRRHVARNVVNVIVIMATLQMGWTIIAEASLSFLGAGVPPPEPTWGNMVSDGRLVLQEAWWVSTFPGLAIAATILAFNLLGDWLRDTLDPHLQVRL